MASRLDHPLDGVTKKGARFCRTCSADRDRERRTHRNHLLRVQRRRGKPLQCERCPRSGEVGTRYEWVNLTGDLLNDEDFVRMCARCHRAFKRERDGVDEELEPQRARWRAHYHDQSGQTA